MAEELTLPTEKTQPRTELSDYTMLLYGREKIGKTTFAAQFPDALFLETEPGTRALSVFSLKIPDWSAFQRAVLLLEKEPKRFRTIVVDTADNLYQWCMMATCRKLGIDHPKDGEYGSGWDAVKKAFIAWNTRLVAHGRGVIWTSHETDKGIKKRSGEETVRIVPTLSKQGRAALEPMVDMLVYYGYEGDDRFLLVKGDETITAGNRVDGRFATVRIPAGNSPKEAFNNFVSSFRNEFVSPSATPAPGRKMVVRRRAK